MKKSTLAPDYDSQIRVVTFIKWLFYIILIYVRIKLKQIVLVLSMKLSSINQVSSWMGERWSTSAVDISFFRFFFFFFFFHFLFSFMLFDLKKNRYRHGGT